MTFASTLATVLAALKPFVDVRCRRCGKLICRWRYEGVASLEVKCARCGVRDIVSLST